MRAMSGLGTTKSDRHRKTHQVEPGGTSRGCWRLTRGDLRSKKPEKSAEAIVVQKGRNGPRAKGRRTVTLTNSLRSPEESLENDLLKGRRRPTTGGVDSPERSGAVGGNRAGGKGKEMC